MVYLVTSKFKKTPNPRQMVDWWINVVHNIGRCRLGYTSGVQGPDDNTRRYLVSYRCLSMLSICDTNDLLRETDHGVT